MKNSTVCRQISYSYYNIWRCMKIIEKFHYTLLKMENVAVKDTNISCSRAKSKDRAKRTRSSNGQSPQMDTVIYYLIKMCVFTFMLEFWY